MDSLGTVVVVVVAASLAVFALAKGRVPTLVQKVAPEGTKEPRSDHEQRLVKLEYQFKALELEWEDTRAKFLGMTRSFIRQAKAAGLDGPNGAGLHPDSQPGASPDAVPGGPSSRAAVLNTWRRTHARQ